MLADWLHALLALAAVLLPLGLAAWIVMRQRTDRHKSRSWPKPDAGRPRRR